MSRDRLPELPGLLVELARAAYGDHLSAVVVHGSAWSRRDFVPFWSDFDCHCYLAPSVLEQDIRERFDRAFAFRRAFAQLDPADFGVYYIQLFFLVADANAFDWATPIEGTYSIVYGERPSGWDRAGRPD